MASNSTPKAPMPPNLHMGATHGAASGGMLGQLQNRIMRQFSPQHMAVTAMMRNMRPRQPHQPGTPQGMPLGSGLRPMGAPTAMPGAPGAALPTPPGGDPVAALHQMVGAAVMQHIAKHMMGQGTPGMPGGGGAPGMPSAGAPGMPKRVPMRSGVMGMKHSRGNFGLQGRMYAPQIGQKPKPGGISVGGGDFGQP